MNKKGFTLIEVIISVVLVSIVLTSMLASLVKLRNSYERVNENTDALVFSSALARIVNNDFEQNGGIRYMDCTYYGDYCDITLNNNQKRKLHVYSVQTEKSVMEHIDEYAKQVNKDAQALKENKRRAYYEEKVNEYIQDIIIERKDGGNTEYHRLSEFYFDSVDNEYDIFINNLNSVYCKPAETSSSEYIYALCTLTKNDDGGNVTWSSGCDCARQTQSTSLKYSDVTSGEEKNIYIKTLSLEKEHDVGEYESQSKYKKGSGKVRTVGYNFGKLKFTNISYDNTSRKSAGSLYAGDYTDSVSLITLEINDGIDTLDSSYFINFSSNSSYPTNSTQIGNLICFNFDNFGNSSVTKVTQYIENFCVRYGVNFSVSLKNYHTKIDKLNNTGKILTNEEDKQKIDPESIGDLYHLPIPSSNDYVFKGYYFKSDKGDEIQVIDENGNIKITTTYFDTSLPLVDRKLVAKWSK